MLFFKHKNIPAIAFLFIKQRMGVFLSHSNSRAFTLFCLVACLFTLTRCAQMGEPNGGLKDEKAPEFMPQKSVPFNNTTNFNASKIKLVFDEYVQVKNQQVVITPALEQKPTIKSKGKAIEIEFNSTLAANTTYTLNFSGAINDITENNVVQNLQYVFSTGPYLDSLSIEGKVVQAFNQNDVAGSTVVLHWADSSVSKSKPAYYLKSGKNGEFKFNNLKQGHYNVYALSDKNADLLFSGYPEELAFLDSVIVLQNNIGGLKLQQFKPLNPKLQLTSTSHISKWSQVYHYNNLINDLKMVGSNPNLQFQQSNTNDSVFYAWLTDTLFKDTVKIDVYSKDSLIDKQFFTAHLSAKTNPRLKALLSILPEFYFADTINILVNMPYTVNKELIVIEDTLQKKKLDFLVIQKFNKLQLCPVELKDKSPLKITCFPGAIKSSITTSVNDTLQGLTTYYPKEKTGSIKLTLNNKNITDRNVYVVLLRDGKEVQQKQLANAEKTIQFDLLKPGSYTFYYLEDSNKDKKWTPGSFELNQQPEKIIWYKQPVKVKANWEQDLIWTF